jgi:hypothetical protein
MAIDFIPVNVNAPLGRNLKDFVTTIRQAVDGGDAVLGVMNHNWDVGDYAALETLFGLPTGTGADVLTLITGTMQALKGQLQTDYALTLIDRVG